MANVFGPLMSLSATGSVAKSLCYKKGTRTTVCRKYAKPSGDPSLSQLAIRQQTGDLMKHWKVISTEDQATWITLADQQDFSPINAYLKFNYERISNGLSTTDVYPPVEAPPVAVVIFSPGVRTPEPDWSGGYYEIGVFNDNLIMQGIEHPTVFLYWCDLHGGRWALSETIDVNIEDSLFFSEVLISVYAAQDPFFGDLVCSFAP
jgi:hypothetical protein